MARKGAQNPGGNNNVPSIQPDSEQDRFCAEISTAATDVLTCLEKIQRLPAGAERDEIVAKAEIILHGAESTGKKIITGTMAGGVALGGLKAVRRKFDSIKKMLDTAGAAGIRAAEKAAADEKARKEKEDRELAQMQKQEDAARLVREADERIARGEGTPEDERLITEHNERILEERRAPIQALFADTGPILKAARKAITKNNPDDARENMALLEGKLASLHTDYDRNAEAVRGGGEDPEQDPDLVFYKDRIGAFEREVADIRSQIAEKQAQEQAADAAAAAEHEAAERESAKREEIGTRFSARITELNGQMKNVFAMPLGNPVEVEAARTSLDVLGSAMDAHLEAWDAEVKPILQSIRLDGAWADLVSHQRALREGFQRDIRARREAVREKMGEAAKERWETELPTFELSLTYAEMLELDARMLRGAKRKEELEALRDRIVRPIVEVWRGVGGERGLRDFAPSLSREQIAAGVRTERAAFDGRMKALEQRIQEGIAADETVKPARLFDIVRTWRNLLARTNQLWNPDTDIGDRGVFLEEKYGPGEVKEGSPEFAAMVSEAHREDFERLAHTEVFRILRRRGREDQRQRAVRERQERMALPQVPKLDFVRLLEEDANWKIRNARFWNPSIKNRDFSRVLRTGKTMTDEELAPFVSDVPAFRSAMQALEDSRARVVETEDVMLRMRRRGEDATLEGKTDAAGVLHTMGGYFQWKRRESQAWSKAMNARGWRISPAERKKRLHEFFRGYWVVGAQALAEVPLNLRGPIGDWANAELHLRIFGRYTQWVLGENAGIAVELRKQRKIPNEFAVDVPEEQIALSDVDRSAVDSFVADHADVEPATSDDDHDDVAEGSFVAGAADTVARFTGAADTEEVEVGTADTERAPEALPTYSAAGGASHTPDSAPIDDRTRLLRENDSWNTIKRLLADDVFWNADADRGTRSTMLGPYRRKGRMNMNRLREDRVTDFEYASAFTDLADLERRVAEVRAKYADAAPAPSLSPITMGPPSGDAPVAVPEPTPAETPVVSAVPEPGLNEIQPILASDPYPIDPDEPGARTPVRRNIVLPVVPPEESVPVAPRSDIPHPPRPVEDVAPVAPVRLEPIPAPAGESDDPFARFFGTGTEAPAAEAPRPTRTESVPVPPARPVARPEVTRPAPVVEIEPTAPASARVEIPIEAPVETPRETHAEDRVASWSRSLRNTFGRLFGSTPAAPTAEAPATRTESVPPAEVSRRTAGGVMGVLSRFFGPKIFADVPQYLPESFGDQNARALLQADILDAMEENAATLKNVAGDPERIHSANLDAAARLDRAISTSRLSPEAKRDMRDRVVALQEKYTERTRENAAARSRELAGIVEQSVRVLEAPGRRGSPALRLLSKLPFGIGTNLAHGVGDFRKRFETAVSRGGDTGLVARVATVFRETWEEAMQGIRANGSLSGRAMNTAEAVAMIGSAYGVSATVTALEQMLPSLRSLTGSERDELSRLAAEGRVQVQEAVDGVLPRAEQAARRAT